MAAMTISRENPFHGVSKLNDSDLTSQVERLNHRRQALDAELLLHLSEFDHRGLYRGLACSSLFAYCTERLGFSEDAAYKRVGAARILRQFPLVYQLLAEGRIHLSALLILRPHLTEANHSDLLLSACGMSKRAVEKLVAALAPRPDIPTQVRKLPPARSAAQESAPSTPIPALRDLAPTPRAPGPTPLLACATKIQPLSSRSYRVVFTASDTFKHKLERARELASHAISPSELPALLERALDLLIEHEEKRRFAIGAKCRSKPSCEPPEPGQVGAETPAKRSRHVPASVRREIWKRDQGRCTFVDAVGRRCNERHFLEIEHRLPHAMHGPSTVENCVLLCRSHNALRAEEVFGRSKIAAKIAHPKGRLALFAGEPTP
jgi:hypothetical protein